MFSYVGLWIAVIYTLIAIVISVVYYFKFPQYHNTRTLLALVAFILLALAELLLLFVQTYSPFPARVDSPGSSIALFTLTMVIFQAVFLYPQWKRQGRKILIVSLAIFAIVPVIYAIYVLYAIITLISH